VRRLVLYEPPLRAGIAISARRPELFAAVLPFLDEQIPPRDT
jgi:hypothetical protein